MAKAINITTSTIKGAELHLQDGSLKVIIYGHTIDDQGGPVKNETLVLSFADVSAGLQSDINGLMRELSQSYNDHFANEPSSTWIDL
jgi:hypothetical protein